MARPEITGQKTGDTDSTTIFDLAGELMPDSMFAKSFNVSTKTIDRWDHNPKLEFPEVVWINGRKYRRVKGLKQFALKRIAAGNRATKREARAPR